MKKVHQPPFKYSMAKYKSVLKMAYSVSAYAHNKRFYVNEGEMLSFHVSTAGKAVARVP